MKKHNLYEQSQTEFDDIYNNIEFLIQSAPLSLKRKIAQSNEDTAFTPNFMNKQYTPSDLVWSEISKNFESVLPHTIDLQSAEQHLKEMSSKQVSTDDFHENYLLEQNIANNQEESTQQEIYTP